jgi:hypothetical protein
VRFGRLSLGEMTARARASAWRRKLTGSRRRTAVAGVAAALVLALAGLAAAGGFSAPRSGAGTEAAGPHSARQAASPAASGPDTRGPDARGAASQPVRRAGRDTAKPAATAPRARTAARVRASVLRTSCRSVAQIGDSTTVDLISPADLASPAQRLGARYRDAGVRHVRISASGGRSIVEVLPGQVNGYNVARRWQSEGYRGCWVFALGTNDAANVAAGSSVGMMARIERMMSVAHGEPVMWVSTRTLLSGGPWAQANEQAWDATLAGALKMYPNMRIFDWAAVARPSWFLPDGIHYTGAGCAHRAQAIASALARAFPRGSHSRSRIVV